MDINWYTSEKIVEEALRAQRATAEVARLAAGAPRYRMRRRIGTVLIKVARTVAHFSDSGARSSFSAGMRMLGFLICVPTYARPRRARRSSQAG